MDESTESTEQNSPFATATVVAAVIGCVSAVLSAVLPWWLGSHGKPDHSAAATANAPVASAMAPITPTPTPLAVSRPKPNLTYGVWTIVNSIDEAGTDFSGSTLKFTSQRETPDGLELTGFFEWRQKDEDALGQEHFVAHFEESSRQLFIEGQYVKSPENRLAVGSFSAKLSDDGRQLIEGRWGNTPNQQAGIPGQWEARR